MQSALLVALIPLLALPACQRWQRQEAASRPGSSADGASWPSPDLPAEAPAERTLEPGAPAESIEPVPATPVQPRAPVNLPEGTASGEDEGMFEALETALDELERSLAGLEAWEMPMP